jgi:hypothetical protein
MNELPVRVTGRVPLGALDVAMPSLSNPVRPELVEGLLFL